MARIWPLLCASRIGCVIWRRGLRFSLLFFFFFSTFFLRMWCFSRLVLSFVFSVALSLFLLDMVVTAAYVFLGKAAEWWVTVDVDSMWWALPTVAACDGPFFSFRAEELPSVLCGTAV